MTICTQDRECLFGEVADGEMLLNDAGRIVADVWSLFPGGRFPTVDIDEYIIMPNHMHGIVLLSERNVGAQFIAPHLGAMTSGIATQSMTSGIATEAQGAIHRAPTLGASEH